MKEIECFCDLCEKNTVFNIILSDIKDNDGHIRKNHRSIVGLIGGGLRTPTGCKIKNCECTRFEWDGEDEDGDLSQVHLLESNLVYLGGFLLN